jgi:hypothetical protein
MALAPRLLRAAGRSIALAGVLWTPVTGFAWGGETARSSAIAYDNSFHKDFVMDAPWRVQDAQQAIPITIVLKDCDTDDIRELHWIHCWDVTGGGSTMLWNHGFNDERIGNDAPEANYWTYITTVTEGHPTLPDGTLLTAANLGYENGAAIQLKVTIYYKDDILNYTETRYLRVHVGTGRFPWAEGWYGGDLHYHTMYTNNVAEFGAPLPAVRATATAMGLDWLVTTDHSCDLDETGDGDLSYATVQWEYTLQSPAGTQTFNRDNRTYGGTWGALGADIADFQEGSFRFIRGEEVNLASIDPASRDKTLHALFVNAEYVHSPRSGSVGERPVSTSVSAGLDQLSADGFVFAAHPTSDLGQELGGVDYAVNGAPWGDADLAEALTAGGFLGLEGFNTRHTRRSEAVGGCPGIFDCDTNPWPDFDAGSSGPYPSKVFREIARWDSVLCSNVATWAEGPAGDGPRKVFFAGGSDAHGDFNYGTHLGSPNYATDNAIGKVQTVARVPGPYGPWNLPPAAEIMAAVRAGRTVVTDGPFLEIGIDGDNDGSWYGAADLQIGDAGSLTLGGSAAIEVRWASLPEWGPITAINLFAGTQAGLDLVFEEDPSGSGMGFEGGAQVSLAGLQPGCYFFRAECATSDGDAGHRAYTNPIWVQLEPTAVAVEDLAATVLGDAVHLTWRLAQEGLGDLDAVRVQRGASRQGPFCDCAGSPLVPQRDMRATDSDVSPGETYWYRLVLHGRDGTESLAGPISILVGAAPATCALYPPLVMAGGQAVQIRYRLADQDSPVQLRIYCPDGRLVRALASAYEAAGEHVRYWDLRGDTRRTAGRGVYFVRLTAGDHTMSRKLVLLHR